MNAGRAALVVAVIALVAAVVGVAGALPGRNSVGSGDIKRNAVRASDIRKGAVRATEIHQGAVRSGEILDKSVAEEDLSDAVALEVLAARRVRMDVGDFPVTAFLEAPPVGLRTHCVDNGGTPAAQVYVETSAEGSAYGPSSSPNFGPFTPLGDRLLIANTSSSPNIETTPFTITGPDGPTLSGVVGAGVQVQGRDCIFTAYGVQGPGFSAF
jgi:hypothetical protein